MATEAAGGAAAAAADVPNAACEADAAMEEGDEWQIMKQLGLCTDNNQQGGDSTAKNPAGAKRQRADDEKKSKAAGLTKSSKKCNRQCRGCGLWFEEWAMATGQSLDHGCKNKIDNIQRIAKSQGRLQWYNEVRSNDVKLQQVLLEYTSRVSACGNRQPRSLTMQYLEAVVASTAVIVEEIGLMMYQKQYQVFAESVDGGRMTETQALAQWAEWLAQVTQINSAWPPTDMKGPSGQRRIWIKTQDLVKFQSKIERKKELQAKGKEIKNADDDEIEKMHKKVQLDHDFMGGRAFGGSLRAQGSQMLAAGGSDVFTNRAMDMPDITALEAEQEEDDVEEGEEDDEADANCGSGGEPSAKKPK